MALVARLANTRVLRLLLVSMAALCAASAEAVVPARATGTAHVGPSVQPIRLAPAVRSTGAEVIWHPRCGYALKAGHPHGPAKKVPGAASPCAFRFAGHDTQTAVQVRTERAPVLPAAPLHDAASPSATFRTQARAGAVDPRLAQAAHPRAPPRRTSSAVVR